MKNKFVGLIFICCFSIVSCSKFEKENNISFQAMDTFMTVRSFGEFSEEANLEVKDYILSLENKISVIDEKSDIFKLNSNQENIIQVGDETFSLLNYAVDFAKKTEGAFNPALYPVTKSWGFTSKKYKVPSETELNLLLAFTDFSKIKFYPENKICLQKNMMVDLGAVGKGFAGDEAIKILKSKGINSALLDLGGNVQLIGGKKNSKGKISDWTVGIKDPDGGSPAAGVKVQNCAVITSGGYERFFTVNGKKYSHIINGKTGCPVENNVKSVTIIADSGLYADSLSTALYVMGKEKAYNFWKQNKNFDFIMILDENKICYTWGIKNKIFLLKNFESVEVLK